MSQYILILYKWTKSVQQDLNNFHDYTYTGNYVRSIIFIGKLISRYQLDD